MVLWVRLFDQATAHTPTFGNGRTRQATFLTPFSKVHSVSHQYAVPNEKSLERAGSVTRKVVVLCSGLVDDGGDHRIIARDAWNLVLLLSLSTPHHGHTSVA